MNRFLVPALIVIGSVGFISLLIWQLCISAHQMLG